MKYDLKHEHLMVLLDYNQETGVFIWKKRLSYRNSVGGIAGNVNKSTGYVRIGINNNLYEAHRLAWFYVNREWPPNHIDHINGDRSDNRLSNLRLATQAENLRNRGKQKNNTSGFKGVSWHKRAEKWVSHIKAGGKMKYLGIFKTPEEAHAAYVEAAKEQHMEFAKC